MVVGFVNSRQFDTYAKTFADYVGGPFCDAAASERYSGYIVVALASPEVGAIYSCETNKISKWFPLDSLQTS
jgi:hypothetical protein